MRRKVLNLQDSIFKQFAEGGGHDYGTARSKRAANHEPAARVQMEAGGTKERSAT